MVRSIVLAIAVSLIPFLQEPPAPETPAPAATVPCESCDGEGQRLERCLACFGDGTCSCWRCMSWTGPKAGDDRDENASAEELAAILKRIREIKAELAAKPVMDVVHKGRRAGMAPCPANGCIAGRSLAAGEDCGYCRGEAVVPCPDCLRTKGRRVCSSCDGKGETVRACETCAGVGTTRDPRGVANPASCLWCNGSGRRACRDCDDEGNVEAACWRCNGGGELACGDCLGAVTVLCVPCNGAGKLKPEKKGRRAMSCSDCKKKGVQGCYTCKKSGRAPCDVCEGDGARMQPCATCAGDRVTPCMGCFRGRYRQWEQSAELLDSMGEPAQALRFLELAAARVGPFFRQQNDLQLDPRSSPEELEARLVAEQARLSRAVELAREKVGSGTPAD